jgi:hypothetical protein
MDDCAKQHYDVIIATPGREIDADYLKSLLSTIRVLNEKGISYHWANGQSTIVHVAREKTLADELAVKTEILDGVSYNKIFWIDSDIVWEPEDFLEIYNSDKDMVSGCYITANEMNVAAFKEPLGLMLTKTMIDTLGSRHVRVGAVGMGFLAIKQGIYESMNRPWFGSVDIPYTDVNGDEKIWHCMSEDIAWCYKATQMGYELWLDTQVKVGHMKRRIIEF